jgi:hypothetical protein
MAFLSIQSVDAGGDLVANRSAAQIASYISIVTSLGSIILSLLIGRKHRSDRETGEAVSVSSDSFMSRIRI